MSVSLENRCDFVGQRWSEFSLVYEREIREQKAGALPDREDSDRETLVQASKEAKVCSSVFQAERNDDAVWDALVDKAADIAAFYNIDPSIPRRAGRQQHRENVEADTPSAYWRRAVYFPFLDHLVSELNELLVKPFTGLLGTISYTR
ncbi:uncharacterized protein [Acropora muricata]|uniref:uncharacterized protein n=1 Tax=Acropora muricata TaxID=159855 RepID=UPI0034E424CA